MSESTDISSIKSKPSGIFGLLAKGWQFLASFSLGIVILLLLTLLTLLGTLSQPTMGLYDTQKKYFDSYFFKDEIFGVPVILPGVYLLLGILFFNMLAGGIIRIRKKPQTIGVIIAHFSIIFLIVAGWVSFHYKKEGNMALLPGEKSDLVTAYNDWQVEIREQGSGEVKVIKDTFFADCTDGRSRTFYKSGLPFQVKISEYARNSAVVAEGYSGLPANATKIDHFAILPQKKDPKNEANLASLIIEAVDANSGASLGKSILSGVQRGPGITERPPFVLETGGKRYAIELNRERWRVPYTLTLNEFKAEYYEGTQKPKVYQSEITKVDGNGSENHTVGMNNPLRSGGYTFFQASFGLLDSSAPQHPEQNPYYTVFAVVKNPSDEWPTYSCIVAAFGLLLHFVIKLWGFLNKMSRKPAPAAPTLSNATVP